MDMTNLLKLLSPQQKEKIIKLLKNTDVDTLLSQVDKLKKENPNIKELQNIDITSINKEQKEKIKKDIENL